MALTSCTKLDLYEIRSPLEKGDEEQILNRILQVGVSIALRLISTFSSTRIGANAGGVPTGPH